MNKGTDLSPLFSQRKDFTIIALTGRNGSGYHRVAQLLELGFTPEEYPDPSNFRNDNNSYKKYRIIYNYAKENFISYTLIRYKDILTLSLIKKDYALLASFLISSGLKSFFRSSKIVIESDFSEEMKNLNNLKKEFENFHNKFKSIQFEETIKDPITAKKFCELFLGEPFRTFSNNLHNALKISFAKYDLLFELITHNIRKANDPYDSVGFDSDKIFSISILINIVIKAIRRNNDKASTKIVIDSLKNPYEINYFKQRFSAFYLISINRDDMLREAMLKKKYKDEYPIMKKILEDEYKGGKGNEFYRRYVRECIEKADIHITYRSKEKTEELNQGKGQDDNTSPYFTVQMQLLKYVSLVDHPGLITPSPEERCMQLAYTAKYNSGCISRQVGAAITDEHYSVKSIGWNNPPEGQVPCLLRNGEALINSSDEYIKEQGKKERKGEASDTDLKAFTPYEKSNIDFKDALRKHFKEQIEENRNLLKGRNICFCFKSLQNSCSEGKNQVHTRSLHAEESAFLQITKYGGTAIKGGKLFTTASPCELCAKKAYQLGIKVIYYVDPYPGISQQQVLEAGTKKPELRLFNGAIGNAYHWLYEPLMAYKDELSIILGQEIKDKLSQMEEELKKAKERINELEMRI